jgi:hypothetical protein
LKLDADRMLVVAYGHILRPRVAEAHPASENSDVLPPLRFELPPHDKFAAIANAIEQPDFAAGLFGEAPVEHAQHRCDAYTTTDQHHRRIAAINMEMAARCAHLQYAADIDLVMEEIRRTARRQIAARRGRHALDRDAVVIRAPARPTANSSG